VVQGPYTESSFAPIGLEKDLTIVDTSLKPMHDMAWTHRAGDGFDIYFISNQRNEERGAIITLRVTDRIPEIWDPVTGDTIKPDIYSFKNGCTKFPLALPANGSVFVVLRRPTTKSYFNLLGTGTALSPINTPWTVTFDSTKGGPAKPVVFEQLTDWSTNNNNAIKYYSGTAAYTNTVKLFDTITARTKVFIEVGKLANIGEVFVNGISCGIMWTPPYRIDVTKAIRRGDNEVRIEVTNTWFNRLKGDQSLPVKERITWTNAPFWSKDKPLLPAGLLGPVTLEVEK
jgi:hypothetical protein